MLNDLILQKMEEKNIKLGCFTLKNKDQINFKYDLEIWDNN